MSRFLRQLALVAALALTGCATQPAGPAPAKAEHAAESLIVKAQKAAAAGHMRAAARDYVEAASKSTQPEVAAQATALAWHARKLALTEKAARRWYALEPGAPGPHHFLVLLALHRHDLDEAAAQSAALLKTGERENDFQAVAEVLQSAGSPYEAFVVMRRLEAEHADVPEAGYALARLATRAGHTRLAREKIDGVLALKPAWPAALFLRGKLLISAGQPEEALAPVRALSRAASDDAKIKIRYAELLFAADQADAARELLHGLLDRQSSRRPKALLLLALDRLDHDDHQRASRYLTLLLESGEQRAQAYYYLGKLAARDDNYRMALDWLRRIDYRNRSAADEMAIASVLERMEKPRAARRFLADARQHEPRNANALAIGEARLLVRQGDSKAALDLLGRQLKPRPKNTEILYARGMLAAQLGHNEQAMADVKRVVGLEPENTAALNALGYMLTEHTSHYGRARQYIETALEFAPHNAAIIDSLGWVEFRQGHTRAALKALRRAHKINDDPEISAHLVAALRAAGEHAEARQVLKRAVSKYPDASSLRQLKPES